MIGFCAELQKYKAENAEGYDTANLNKNEVYDVVSVDYMLPPVNSRGITRDYLLDVKQGKVFRIPNMEWKTYEFGLNKSHNKKVGVINNSLLVRKLNMILKDRGQPPLGFTEVELPEQNWLFKVARYIDRTGLLEFFETSPFPEPPLDHNSSAISKIYYGRLYAGEWLFRIEKAKKNKRLWEAFTEIAEKHRMLCSLRVNLDVLEHELQVTKNKIDRQETELHDMVGKAAFTYTALEDPAITPDVVIQGGSSMTEAMKKQLNTNAQL